MGRFDNMSARECARVAAHCGQLDVEEKKAGIKKWRRKWFALWHSPAQLGGNDMVLLCFEDEDAYKPTGTARLERGTYQVQPPKQPRRGHPNCFRISIDSAGGADKKGKGKYILNALSKESMEAWVEALQPQVTHLSALLYRPWFSAFFVRRFVVSFVDVPPWFSACFVTPGVCL